MADGLNNCCFIGNLGNDPETRQMPNGNSVTEISIGVGYSWKDKNSGQKQEKTEWVRVTAFGRLGEIMTEYLRKGSKVHISGRMQTDKYQDSNGMDKYSTKIIANNMLMLDSRNADSSGNSGYSNPPANRQSQDTPPDPDFDDD